MSDHPVGRVHHPSLLAHALDTLDDDDFHRVKAVGIAAGVVATRLFGLTVTSAWCVRVRYDGNAGKFVHEGPDINTQHHAVRLLTPAQAAARALPKDAHPLAAAAVEEITAQENRQTVQDLLVQGYAVWRRRAEIDAGLLLDEPLLWAKVCEVADALIDAGARGLDQSQIETLVGDPCLLTDHQVWAPDLDGLNLP